MASRLRAQRVRIGGGDRGDRRGRRGRIDARTRPSTQAIGPPWLAVCVRQQLLELFQPGALLRRVERRDVEPARGPGGSGRTHARSPSLRSSADQADQIAARAGARR